MDNEAVKLFNGEIWAKDGDRVEINSPSLTQPIDRGDGFSDAYSKNIDPPRELFNQILCETTAAAKEVVMGVSEWDSEVNYPAGAITNQNGNLYYTNIGGKNKNPSTSSVWNIIGSRVIETSTPPLKILTANIFVDSERADRFRIFWNNPDNGGEPITSANLKYSKNSNAEGGYNIAYRQGQYINISGDDSDAYYFKIYVRNAIGNGPESDPIKVRENPLSPPKINQFTTLVGAASQRVDLNWDAVFPSNGLTIKKYRVEWKSGDENFDGTGTRHKDVTSGTSTNIEDLTNGTEYTFRIVVVSNRDTENAGTFTASATPSVITLRPGTPNAPLLVAEYKKIIAGLSNLPSNSGSEITQYDWQYKLSSDAEWEDTSSTTNPYKIIDRLSVDAYDVRVRAVNISGAGGWSDSSSVTPANDTPPILPTRPIAKPYNNYEDLLSGTNTFFYIPRDMVSYNSKITDIEWQGRAQEYDGDAEDWGDWNNWAPLNYHYSPTTTEWQGWGSSETWAMSTYNQRALGTPLIRSNVLFRSQCRCRVKNEGGWSNWSPPAFVEFNYRQY